MKNERIKNESPEDIPDGLKKLGHRKHFQKGEMLFSVHDKAEGFYFVESGEIRVFKMDEQGREVEVVRLSSGDFLGEAIVFVSSVYPVFAQAVMDSDVLFFAKTRIHQEITQNPGIALYFVDLLARKCVVLSSKIESLGLRTVRQRLIQYLLSRCSGEQQCLVELKVKKGELAKILGTISETLSRNLKHMQDEGLIEVEGNKVMIKNCTALREELLPSFP
ncbi:MAG: Crp/Fnr family transcriptional regulator [Candidatus Aminicenantes bacterium]|nr:MAG: Crp/Fnr family transcriptional regulator [Candidatus Aminicenantes bacterium]